MDGDIIEEEDDEDDEEEEEERTGTAAWHHVSAYEPLLFDSTGRDRAVVISPPTASSRLKEMVLLISTATG